MLSFRQVQFDNGAVMFLRPADHDAQIDTLMGKIVRKELVLEDTTVEKAAAWNMAVYLFHMPAAGWCMQ